MKCDNFYAFVIPILIKPVAIMRVLVVGHTSPMQTPPPIPLYMSWEFHRLSRLQLASANRVAALTSRDGMF